MENPQFQSGEDETSSNEGLPPKDGGQQIVKAEVEVEVSSREKYWNNVRRIVSLLPSSLDHISDIMGKLVQSLTVYNLSSIFEST